jgi:hypothetical protein
MRKEKALTALLQDLVKLLAEEAARNAQFAAQLDALLTPVPSGRTQRKRRVATPKPEDIPDIHAEFSSRGESEFHLWLRDQPVAMLRALIRVHDLDAARRTNKWKDPDKLSAFITEQMSARLARGSGFLSARDSQREP